MELVSGYPVLTLDHNMNVQYHPTLAYYQHFSNGWKQILLEQNRMQGWQYGEGLIYLRPIFRITKLAFL